MVIMYLFTKKKLTCPKEQIMHKELSLALTVLQPYINSFENSMKSYIYFIHGPVKQK